MIELKDFSYTYGTAETPVLKKINLEVRQGELLLVTGHSAAGKTTLALAIAGILHHEIEGKIEGEIIFKNQNVKSFNGMKELSRHIGMVFDDAESQLIFTSVEEEIHSGLENRGYSNSGNPHPCGLCAYVRNCPSLHPEPAGRRPAYS